MKRKVKTSIKKNIKTTIKIDYLKAIIVVLVGLNLVLALYVTFFKKDALWLEQLKSGWKWNFTLIEKLYKNDDFKLQQKQQLTEVLESMGAEVSNENVDKVLDQETMDNLLKDTFVNGNENTRFVIIEYSDFFCWYCKRHYDDKTLQKIQEKYPNNVALIFKNMPSGSPEAILWAEATKCAGKLWWKDAFYKFIEKAFIQNTFNDDVIKNIAKEIGVNATKLLECTKNWEFKSKIENNRQEAYSLFWMNGTPGNVILDTETGKYVIINWAYPFEKFDAEIQNLMK